MAALKGGGVTIFSCHVIRQGSKWAGLSFDASGDKLCGKMREKDLGSKKTAVTTAIQEEVSMRIHGGENEGERERDRETGVRLMSFAQTVRREANVIYEDRTTSRVDEVSRLENL